MRTISERRCVQSSGGVAVELIRRGELRPSKNSVDEKLNSRRRTTSSCGPDYRRAAQNCVVGNVRGDRIGYRLEIESRRTTMTRVHRERTVTAISIARPTREDGSGSGRCGKSDNGTTVKSIRAGIAAIDSRRGARYRTTSGPRFCECKRKCLYRCRSRCTSFGTIRRRTGVVKRIYAVTICS